MRNQWVWWGGLALVAMALAGVGRPTDAAGEAGSSLKPVVDRYLQWRLTQYPEWATAMGDHRNDDKIRDMSAAAIARRGDESRRFAAELQAIAPAGLGLEDRVDREILLGQMELDRFNDAELQTWRHDPLVYTSLASDSVYDLLKRDYAPIGDRLRSAIARMRALPRLLEQARTNLDGPPRIKTEIAIAQTKGAIDLFEVVVNGAATGTPLAGEVREASASAAAALRAYQEWLTKTLLTRSRDEWRLGAARYDRGFKLETGSAQPPLEVLRRAEADAMATRERMRVVAAGNWDTFRPGVPRPDDPDEVVRQVMDAMADAHPEPSDFIPALQRASADLKRFIREKHLLELPEPDTLSIRATPDFQAGLFHGQLEYAPPLEKDGASIYTTSGTRPYPGPDGHERMIGFLREFNSKALVNLITHEGYPGHYVQGRYAARCPSLVRRVFSNGTYAEGWAVYSEWMMLQEGFGGGDPGLELQMLKMQLKVTGNAILDIKLHRGLMREEDVIPFLVSLFQTPGEAKSKLTRAKGTAVQLTTYYIGYLEMRDLRRDYERGAGASFKLSDFHHKVLEAGAPPMRLLRELVLR